MIKKTGIFFAIFIFFFSVNTGLAQTWNSQIGLSTGVSFSGYYDKTVSPVKRYSTPINGIIFGNFENNILMHSFNINFFMGSARRIEPYIGFRHIPSYTIRGYIDYSLTFNLFERGFYKLHVGGGFRTYVHYTGPTSGDAFSQLNPTGIVLFSLDLNLRQTFTINSRNSISLSLKTPIVGYAIRPPFAGLDELWLKYMHEGAFLRYLTLGRVTSFHNYFAFLGSLKYHFKINNIISVFSGIAFEYSFVNFYHPREDIIFSVNAGITFLF